MANPPPLDIRRYPAVEPAYPDATVAPYIVRPLFFVLTVIFLISAVGQLGGRILFANLERLETRLNVVLADQGVAVSGLSGDWRFFNPILKVASLTAPGVETGAAWAEIDTLESLSRNRLVLRSAAADAVQLALVQNEAGAWSLEGQAPSNSNFDWRSLVWHSDELDVQASVGIRGFGRPASELALTLSFSNFGGRHRGRVRVGDADGCATCGLNAQYNVEEAALWFRERQGGAVLQAENFELRDSLAAFAGLSYLKLGELDGRLRLQGERFSGPLSLLNSELQLPGGNKTGLSLLAEGWSIDDGSNAALQITALQLASAGTVLDVRDALVNWNSESGAQLLVPELNVGSITDVVGSMLPGDVPTARWIRRLGMTGTFTRLLGSWSTEAGLGFGGDFHNVFMQSVGGVPSVADLEGSFTGGPKYLQLRLLEAQTRVGFPQLYREELEYASVSGQILMYFGQDYFGLKGSNLNIVDEKMTTKGSFSLASTKPLTDNHLTIALEANAQTFDAITPYVPYTLPQQVLDWLATSDLSADVIAPRFIMHGPLREEESGMKRSYLVEAEMRDGGLVFNPEWPRITEADGLVRVSHDRITAQLSRAKLLGMSLTDMSLWLPAGAARITAQGRATFDAAAGLEFLRTTPLRESMDFVADDWWADGNMRLDLQLDLPLDDRAGNELDSRVMMQATGTLRGTTFGLPEAGLVFNDLRGGLSYSYPYELNGRNIKGTLFGRPMKMGITSSVVASAPAGQPKRFAPRRMDFEIAGAMHSDDMWPLMGMDASDVVAGTFDFGAVYSTETDTGALPSVSIETEFLGAQINLPAPLGKLPDERTLTIASVEFGDTDQRAQLLFGGLLSADLGIDDNGISGGHMRLLGAPLPSAASVGLVDVAAELAVSVGISTDDAAGSRAASWDEVKGAIKIDGYLASADIAEWAGGESSVELPAYEITGLTIGQATLGDVAIPGIALTGSSDSERLQLDFSSDSAEGSLLVPEVDVTELLLRKFSYETDDYDPGQVAGAVADLLGTATVSAAVKEVIVDPVGPEMMDTLQDMKVRIDALTVDGEDYGQWGFRIAREESGIAFKSLNAMVKNLEVESPDGVLWTRADNRTAFKGTITAKDMGDVLEAWGYARSIESKSMNTSLDVSWEGSPLNFELLQTRGDIDATVRTGRFLDVTSGGNALRMFSLLNFTAIAKRMSLNFKDVFGRGVSFENVESVTQLDDGMLTFRRPLRVEGTGGDFKVNGRINLATGELDNEMVVTLPVNKSLPWLGAYLALANPVVGIGVLVGERLLRKPIQGLSSAKYRITGNTDDPKLELVSVFDRSMDDTPADSEAVEAEADVDAQPEAPTGTGVDSAAEPIEQPSGVVSEPALDSDTTESELTVVQSLPFVDPTPILDPVPLVQPELGERPAIFEPKPILDPRESEVVPEAIEEDPGAESFRAADSPEEVSQAN